LTKFNTIDCLHNDQLKKEKRNKKGYPTSSLILQDLKIKKKNTQRQRLSTKKNTRHPRLKASQIVE
jgi:hypothetical protein